MHSVRCWVWLVLIFQIFHQLDAISSLDIDVAVLKIGITYDKIFYDHMSLWLIQVVLDALSLLAALLLCIGTLIVPAPILLGLSVYAKAAVLIDSAMRTATKIHLCKLGLAALVWGSIYRLLSIFLEGHLTLIVHILVWT